MSMMTFRSQEDHRHSELEETIKYLLVSSVSPCREFKSRESESSEKEIDTEGSKQMFQFISCVLPIVPVLVKGHLFWADDLRPGTVLSSGHRQGLAQWWAKRHSL